MIIHHAAFISCEVMADITDAAQNTLTGGMPIDEGGSNYQSSSLVGRETTPNGHYKIPLGVNVRRRYLNFSERNTVWCARTLCLMAGADEKLVITASIFYSSVILARGRMARRACASIDLTDVSMYYAQINLIEADALIARVSS